VGFITGHTDRTTLERIYEQLPGACSWACSLRRAGLARGFNFDARFSRPCLEVTTRREACWTLFGFSGYARVSSIDPADAGFTIGAEAVALNKAAASLCGAIIFLLKFCAAQHICIGIRNIFRRGGSDIEVVKCQRFKNLVKSFRE
jgi:hypothetical protein